MKNHLLAFICIVYFSPDAANAQSTYNTGLFPTIDHSGTLSKKFDYSLYYFAAINMINSKVNNKEQNPGFFAFYAEQAITFKANPELSFTASYVFEKQNPAKSNYRNENRFYLQSTFKHNVSRVSIKHRLRFDGRFIQNRVSGKTPFTSRIRYLAGLQVPLRKTSDKFYLTGYNEFFFNTENISTPTYAENWAYAAVGVKLNKSNSIEAGPLFIRWANNREKDYSNFYYLQLSWISHVDFRKVNK